MSEYAPPLEAGFKPRTVEFSLGSLAYAAFGPEDGRPVIAFHGTLGSLAGPRPSDEILEELGVRWIGWDRIGYGDTYGPTGDAVITPAGTPHAVARILDDLGILHEEQVSLVGFSAGGPHALACAADVPHGLDALRRNQVLRQDEIKNVVVWGSLSPGGLSATGVNDRLEGFNRQAAHLQHSMMPLVSLGTIQYVATDSHAYFRDYVEPSMSPADRELVSGENRELARLIIASYRRAVSGEARLSTGALPGYTNDLRTNLGLQPWGFDPEDVRTKVTIMHGWDDPFSPHEHAGSLEKSLSRADVRRYNLPGGHFEGYRRLRHLLYLCLE